MRGARLPWSEVRETACFLWGHDWKSSSRKRADYQWRVAIDYDSPAWKECIPYAEREYGNPFYEWSLGWHFKCRRCRTTTKDWAWNPWWRDLWIALRVYRTSWWIAVTTYWPRPRPWNRYPRRRYPWSAWLLSVVTSFGFAWEQSYAGWAFARRWPLWPAWVGAEDRDYIHTRWIDGRELP